MQQLPKEFVGRMVRTVYRSGGSLLRGSSYIWNVCGIQI